MFCRISIYYGQGHRCQPFYNISHQAKSNRLYSFLFCWWLTLSLQPCSRGNPNNILIFWTLLSQVSKYGLLAISCIALLIMLSLLQFCNDHSYFRQFFNANIKDGYLPNSPSAANLLHLLCTDRSSLHIFWFRTSKLRFSQDLRTL